MTFVFPTQVSNGRIDVEVTNQRSSTTFLSHADSDGSGDSSGDGNGNGGGGGGDGVEWEGGNAAVSSIVIFRTPPTAAAAAAAIRQQHPSIPFDSSEVIDSSAIDPSVIDSLGCNAAAASVRNDFSTDAAPAIRRIHSTALSRGSAFSNGHFVSLLVPARSVLLEEEADCKSFPFHASATTA